MKRMRSILHWGDEMGEQQKSAADLMPQGKEVEEILRARAELLANEKIEIVETVEGIAFVRFTIGQNEVYGIPYQYVKEVLHNVKAAPLPCTPSYLIGVINWRGALIPVIDLKHFFHSESTKCVTYPYGIIVRAEDVTIGIGTDTIEGSDNYHPLNLSAPLTSANAANAAFIVGVHEGVTAIINIEAVISALKVDMEKQSPV